MLTYGASGRFAEAAPSAQDQVDQLAVQKAQLELIAAQEAVKTAQSDRIWTAVGGIVAIASLVVSIAALRRGR